MVSRTPNHKEEMDAELYIAAISRWCNATVCRVRDAILTSAEDPSELPNVKHLKFDFDFDCD